MLTDATLTLTTCHSHTVLAWIHFVQKEEVYRRLPGWGGECYLGLQPRERRIKVAPIVARYMRQLSNSSMTDASMPWQFSAENTAK
jgi:hypothetical protein